MYALDHYVNILCKPCGTRYSSIAAYNKKKYHFKIGMAY